MMSVKDHIFRICDDVRHTSYALHKYLRYRHSEKVYENGLTHRLRKLGIDVTQQAALCVYDEDGTILGEFIADMVVEHCIVVEIKACRALLSEHVAQLLGYLRASGLEHGILINFGASQMEIKKYVLSKR